MYSWGENFTFWGTVFKNKCTHFFLIEKFKSTIIQLTPFSWESIGDASVFPDGASGKELTCQCRSPKSRGFNPWVRIPGGRNGNPLQYSCLENPLDRGAWWGTVHGVAKSWPWLKWLSTHAHTGDASGFSLFGWVLSLTSLKYNSSYLPIFLLRAPKYQLTH